MNNKNLREAVKSIAALIEENKNYLVELDAKNGDGDLGISMSGGFNAIASYLENSDEKDLGKLFMKLSSVFNAAAPSSLGTILCFGMMGMATDLKGSEEITLIQLANALETGLNTIMKKAKSKPGEKTILDSLYPGIVVLKEKANEGALAAFTAAAIAATQGSESTKHMRPVHGRAAYYGDKSTGMLDGGSVVGQLIFEGILEYCKR